MQCPFDQKELKEIEERGFTYFQCLECKGVWMRERALRAVVKQIDPDAAIKVPHADDAGDKKRDNNNLIKCPHDGLYVVEHKLGKVNIDICPACSGVWLDPGELTAILDELQHREVQGIVGKSVAHLLGHLIRFHWTKEA
jgi:Zn-finger nucleic acid-binding protein